MGRAVETPWPISDLASHRFISPEGSTSRKAFGVKLWAETGAGLASPKRTARARPAPPATAAFTNSRLFNLTMSLMGRLSRRGSEAAPDGVEGLLPGARAGQARRSAARLAAVAAALSLAACLTPASRKAGTPVLLPAQPAVVGGVQLTDVTAQAGLRFVNEHGSALPLTLVETMGGGAAFLDYDGDGWLDVYLVSEAGWQRLL